MIEINSGPCVVTFSLGDFTKEKDITSDYFFRINETERLI